jgi:hypothetical protein
MTGRPVSVPEILALADRVRCASPAPGPGPGWSACVRGKDAEVVATLSFLSYDQVASFGTGMERLGYEMLILDPDPTYDFIFRRS